MSWSANEIAGLALKAARGAGAPPDQAAWFGRAAAVHAAQGRDAEDLDKALAALPGGPIMELYLAISTLHFSCDAKGVAEGDIKVKAPDELVHSYLEALPFQTEMTANPDVGWHVELSTLTPAFRGPVGRARLPDALVARMRKLAAKTFVPETEASRQAGAGAGLLDND